jgi:hypothetical protein
MSSQKIEEVFVPDDFQSFEIAERNAYTDEQWAEEIGGSNLTGKIKRAALRQFVELVDSNGLNGEAAYFDMIKNYPAGANIVAKYFNQSNEAWLKIRDVLNSMQALDHNEG